MNHPAISAANDRCTAHIGIAGRFYRGRPTRVRRVTELSPRTFGRASPILCAPPLEMRAFNSSERRTSRLARENYTRSDRTFADVEAGSPFGPRFRTASAWSPPHTHTLQIWHGPAAVESRRNVCWPSGRTPPRTSFAEGAAVRFNRGPNGDPASTSARVGSFRV